MSRRPIRRAFDVVTATGFLVALSLPGIWTVLRPGEPSPSPFDPPVAPKPEPPRDAAGLAAFPGAFQDWFRDHFGFRPELRRAHDIAWFRVLGMSPHPVVTGGREGALFGTADLAALGRDPPLTDEQLAQGAKVLQARRDWLAARGIRYLIVLAPKKSSVYPELIPASMPVISRERPAEQFACYLAAHTTVPVLDVTPALLTAKGGSRQLFPRLDVHWGDYGGYIAYRAVAGRLAEWFPAITPIPEECCIAEDLEVTGDLAVIMGFPDLLETRTYMRPAASRATGLEGWGGVQHGATRTATSRVDDPCLPATVVFHDSFLSAQKQFLAEHFRSATYRWVYAGFDAAAVEEAKPDVVIQEMFEGALPTESDTEALPGVHTRARP